jgi:hypothetical protein
MSSCWFPKHAHSLPSAHGVSVYQLLFQLPWPYYLRLFFLAHKSRIPFFFCRVELPFHVGDGQVKPLFPTCRRSSSQTAISNPNVARSWWLKKINAQAPICISNQWSKHPTKESKHTIYYAKKNIETNHEAGKELVLLAKLAGAAPPSTLRLPTKQVMGLIRRVSEFSRILRYCV